jgi:hypothetical protein
LAKKLKTVFFYDNPILKDIYWADDSKIFFDDRGWWLLENGTRNLVSTDEFVEVIYEYGNINVAAIIRELRSWGPVWSRWCGKGDQQELILRSALVLILAIAAGMRKLDVSVSVMHTGVSHHIDSVVFQMACQLADVKLVFLYSEVMSTRLIPLLQQSGIESRHPLDKKISNFAHGDQIRDFLTNKRQDLPPQNNIKIRKTASTWQLMIPYLFCKDIVHMIRLLRNNLIGRKNKAKTFDFASGSYPFQYTQQAIQQSYALQYLKRSIKPASSFQRQVARGASLSLILAAHFQPEATSFPEGGDWGNHVDVVLEIFNKGYRGPLLYKEHPATSLYLEGRNPTRVGMSRSVEYYRQLEQLGCEFIDTDFRFSIDPQKNQWYLPITITGTIAIERALAGFHTIVTGYPWFRGMPGVLHLSQLGSLSEIRPEWGRPDPGLANRAFDFLEALLSSKTIINVPGIGTGQPLTSKADQATYAEEFAALLQAIDSHPD